MSIGLAPSTPKGWQESRLLLGFGILLFLAAKLYFVCVGTALTGMPRLGDDAYVYLWKGKVLTQTDEEKLPAVRELLEQARSLRPVSRDERWWSSRIQLRVDPHSPRPLGNAITRAALEVSPDPKVAFLLTELLGVVAMTAGFTLFLLALFGTGATGIGLLLLAFAAFPNQGITHFVHSTLALSLATGLWAYVLWRGREARRPVVWVGSVLLIAVHPVGLIYALATIPFQASAILANERGSDRWYPWLTWVGVVVVAGAFALATASGRFSIPDTGADRLGLWLSLKENLAAVMPYLRESLMRNPVLFAGFAAALVMTRNAANLATSRGALVVVIVLMVGSLFHYLFGYPGELFSRLLILFGVLAAGFAGYFIASLKGLGRHAGSAVLAVWLALALTFWVNRYTFSWLRPEIIDDKALAQEMHDLPPNSRILYAETDISMMAALLAGAEHYHAFAFPLVATRENSIELASAFNPDFIVMPNFPTLNTLTAKGIKKWVGRHSGFLLPVVKSLEISGEKECLEEIQVRITGGNGIGTLTVAPSGASTATEHSVPLSSADAWLPIWRPAWGCARSIDVKPGNASGWIVGISEGTPDERLRWPWRSRIKVIAKYIESVSKSQSEIVFSPEALLDYYGARALAPLVDKDRSVISDQSGVVLLGGRRRN